MNLGPVIQIGLATTGILNFLVLAVFLLFARRGNVSSNRVLGLLLFAVCLKLSFGILISIRHEWGLFSYIVNSLSIAAYLSFGPLLHLYYQYLFHHKIKRIYTLLFFVPVCVSLFEPVFTFRIPIGIVQLYFGAFLVFIFIRFRIFLSSQSETRVNLLQRKWAKIIFISFLLVWAAVNLLIIDIRYYFVELLLFVVALFYFDIYWVFRHYWLKKGEQGDLSKGKKRKLSDEEVRSIVQNLKRLMEKEHLYLDPELTLPKVASLLHVKVYKLSYVINQELNMTFNEYINAYRIREITRALSLPDNQNEKILSLAFDYGFNSISVFNAAFKKCTSYTPSEYREQALLKSNFSQ
ncbi:MAG TPA: helix-turn-helix transcriptional regulator [Prolixibacteraceae bacterium]|nr:helix-turn-helix transcriptional regulator [Prolixibacteraceae bacterium]